MIDLRYGRDVLDALREIPDATVQCCVTSPPYYGLRNYKTGRWEGGDPGCGHVAREAAANHASLLNGADGRPKPEDTKTRGAHAVLYRDRCAACGATRVDSQIGLEPTLDEFLARLVSVFREVRRVLHPTGVLWVNMGDSYGGEKSLLNVPYRLAFALADDGWLHRDTVIWHKPAPMPESVRDRCTKAWEPIFMFTRQPRYFADMEGVKQRAAEASVARVKSGWDGNRVRGHPSGHGHNFQRYLGTENGAAAIASGANLRNVWRMSSEPYKGAHFATFPSELPRRCLKIGTSPRGCCPTCRAPWVRLTERKAGTHNARWSAYQREKSDGVQSGGTKSTTLSGIPGERHTTGWQQSCRCPAAEPIPCTVLDPFCGSGTTMQVAAELGLDGIGIDLSSDYLPLARERVGALYLRREESA